MSQRPDLNQLSNEQLRALTADLFDRMENKDRALIHRDAVIEKLTHEVAILKRHKFAQRSEQLDAVQGNLLDELIDGDLAAIEAELGELTADEAPTPPKKQPKRAPLPPELPRTLIHHEPENTQCRCGCGCGCQLKRVGEDISEKLDYVHGEFTVERHIRGKWACEQCETLIQAPVPAQVIDKGIPTPGLLAQVLGSLTSVPPRTHLQSRRSCDPACLGGNLRRAVTALGGCAEKRPPTTYRVTR